MVLFAGIAQVAAVTAVNVRTIPQRWVSSLVAVVGIAGVVLVVVAVLSIGAGFKQAMVSRSDPSTIVITRASSTGEMDSVLSRDEMAVIANAPGIANDANGLLVSGELYVVVDVPRVSTGGSSNVPLRGVEAQGLAVRGNVEVIEGRLFRPGLNEVVVGKSAANQFAGLKVGDTHTWRQSEWVVTGIIDADGGVPDSEIWADTGAMQSAWGRSGFQVARVRLTDEQAFTTLSDTLSTDPRVNLTVERETDFYAERSQVLSVFVTTIGWFVGALMGIGAMFGAVNTMYNAVASRTREIATLRALGFGAIPVTVSVLVESMLLALVGGLLGGVAAWLVFNGFEVATINWQTFSQVSFTFAVTPPLLIGGTIYALVLGLFGGIFPAIRAARMPLTVALREL
ncbi:MAG: FtsX-like permease family protein [Pseudomonadota bacterium]